MPPKQPRLPNGSKLIARGEGVDLYEIPPNPRRRYPVWKVDALERDVEMARQNIQKFKDHIADQEKLIAERMEQIALCKERDREIAKWERDRANSDFPSFDKDD